MHHDWPVMPKIRELSRVATTSGHTAFLVLVYCPEAWASFAAILRGNTALSCGAAIVRVNESQAVSSE
jgi:hypothetical protein